MLPERPGELRLAEGQIYLRCTGESKDQPPLNIEPHFGERCQLNRVDATPSGLNAFLQKGEYTNRTEPAQGMINGLTGSWLSRVLRSRSVRVDQRAVCDIPSRHCVDGGLCHGGDMSLGSSGVLAVIPRLFCCEVEKEIKFCVATFDAVEIVRRPGPD